MFEKFSVIDLIKTRSASVCTFAGNVVKFNVQTAQELRFPEYIQFLIEPKSKQFAIRACKEDAPNAVRFSKPEGEQKAQIKISNATVVDMVRKLMDWNAEDNWNVPGIYFAEFLGYRKGADGFPEVVPEEAIVVHRIYTRFMEGLTPGAIAKELTADGIPTPSRKQRWQTSTVESILQNEKYKGAALLQKCFTVDFLTKKRKVNEGEVPQYYVKHSHEPIITPEEFDKVQRKEYFFLAHCLRGLQFLFRLKSLELHIKIPQGHLAMQRQIQGRAQMRNAASGRGNH